MISRKWYVQNTAVEVGIIVIRCNGADVIEVWYNLGRVLVVLVMIERISQNI